MRVLVTGAGGQVGAAVARLLASRAEVIAHERATLDLADRAQIETRVREAAPDVIVNAAAYTAVDRAESDADTAQAVNATAPGLLGEAARRANAVLVHFSTDYVFDGTKAAPYVEGDATNPLGAYGRTKLAGEQAIAASGCAYATLRTAWVYGPTGKNFLLTMLRLASQGNPVRVVDDQRGAPTSSLQIARAVVALLTAGEGMVNAVALDRIRAASGLYHATAAGETTWHGFATEIFAQRAHGPGGSATPPAVTPIATREYPTPAKRPAYSVLSSGKLESTFGVRLGDWRAGLSEALSVLGRG